MLHAFCFSLNRRRERFIHFSYLSRQPFLDPFVGSFVCLLVFIVTNLSFVKILMILLRIRARAGMHPNAAVILAI
jgi:hypothetical protein